MIDNIYLYSWFWWRNRISILIMLGSVLVSQAVFWMGDKNPDEAMPSLFLMVAIAATSFSAIAVFSFGSNLDLTSGRSSFPSWLFNLPVTSMRLALIPVLAMVFAFAWAWIPAASALNQMWESRAAKPEMLPSSYNFLVLPWLGLSAFGLWLQAIAWWPFGRPWARMCCLGLLAFALAFLVSIGQVFDLGPWFPTLATAVPAVGGFAAALWSATRARHMNWRSEAAPDSFLIISPRGESDERLSDLIARPFRSSVSAIAWRDWKQLGRAPMMLMLLICVPMALLVSTVSTSYRSIAFLFFVPAMLLAFVGPMLGKSRYWKENYELSPFLAALPISDDQFVKSRYANTFKTSCTLWLCVFAVAMIWFVRESNRAELLGMVEAVSSLEGVQTGWSAVVVWLSITFYLVAVAPWTGLALGLFGRKWLKRTVVLVCGVLGLATFIYVCSQSVGLISKVNHPQFQGEVLGVIQDGIRGWLGVGLIIKVIVTVALLVYASRSQVAANSTAMPVRLIEPKPFLMWGAVLIVLCALTAWYLVWMLVPFGFERWDVVMAVILTFPMGSIVASRIALDFNRHR